jgi:hypothetical protein
MIEGSSRPGEKKLVLGKPITPASLANGPNWGSSRNDHITAPTTAGTANGMKKIVRHSAPYFARPRSKIVAKKNAMASMTGIWMPPKMITRITPDQKSPEVSVWV